LWLTARNSFENLHCAANRYWDYGKDFFDGPIVAVYDSAYDRYYGRVWKVTQTQIAQFKTLTFPTSANLVDSAILHWPGKGNPSVQTDYGVTIASPLAPFVDLNGNGIYEPLLGDYPAICGNEGIFFVYNDIRAAHTQTNGTPLGVEIRGMASSFIDSTSSIPYAKRVVNNAIFVQYEIENKSATNYTGLAVANWVDGDLGCFDNDRVGCDSARNMMFTYNGVAIDPDCAPENGYGSLPIALGVKLLNRPMSVFGYFTGQGASAPAVSDPITAGEYRYLSEGLWNDGTPFTYRGSGYNGVSPTKLLFPGDPNDTSQWSEVEAGFTPGDRRMFASTDSMNFNAGEIKHFDYAFFSSFDMASDYLGIVDTLKQDADIISSFYQNTVVPCQNQIALSINNIPAANQFTVSIYPNPANNQVAVECSNDIQTVQLLDVEGRVLFAKTVDARKVVIPVNTLARGVYLVNVVSGGTSVVKKLVVE
jgi:hypothetical protein